MSVDEDAPVGTLVSQLIVTDAQNESYTDTVVTFALVGVSRRTRRMASAFVVNQSGAIFTNALLDSSTKATYNLTVVASDGSYSTQASFNVQVVDVPCGGQTWSIDGTWPCIPWTVCIEPTAFQIVAPSITNDRVCGPTPTGAPTPTLAQGSIDGAAEQPPSSSSPGFDMWWVFILIALIAALLLFAGYKRHKRNKKLLAVFPEDDDVWWIIAGKKDTDSDTVSELDPLSAADQDLATAILALEDAQAALKSAMLEGNPKAINAAEEHVRKCEEDKLAAELAIRKLRDESTQQEAVKDVADAQRVLDAVIKNSLSDPEAAPTGDEEVEVIQVRKTLAWLLCSGHARCVLSVSCLSVC